MTHDEIAALDAMALAALPVCLRALLADDQSPDEITMPDNAFLLSDSGRKALEAGWDAFSERGLYLSQACRFELSALVYQGQNVLLLVCSFFNDFVCTYQEAMHCDALESSVAYLFTDYASASAAFTKLIDDMQSCNSDAWHA